MSFTDQGEAAMAGGGGGSSIRIRDALESRLERDLLGPWDGPEEELPPGVQPAERYLLGRLVPASPSPAPTADDPESDAADDAAPVPPEMVDAGGQRSRRRGRRGRATGGHGAYG